MPESKLHTEHPGIFWAGDVAEAWCLGCGQPGATSAAGVFWHRYATHIVECPEDIIGHSFIGASCDWGYCDNESVGIRFDGKLWLPVCELHLVADGQSPPPHTAQHRDQP